MKQWANDDLLEWAKQLDLCTNWTNTLLEAIKDTGCDGKDLWTMRTGKDVADAFGTNPMHSNRIFREIKKTKKEEMEKYVALYSSMNMNISYSSSCYEQKSNDQFELSIFGESRYHEIKELVTTETTIKYVKQLYKRETGSRGCLDCMGLYSNGHILGPNQTLGQVGINNEKHLITVMFKRYGGGLTTVWYANGALQVGRNQQKNSSKPIAEFAISSFHVSCQSDKLSGKDMIGIVIYLCDNKQFFYLNGMKCRSGYILLVNSEKIKSIKTKDGTWHSKAFKHFVGKDLQDMNVVGGGFSIQNGTPIFRSGTFNTGTPYHDKWVKDIHKEMHILEKQCIKAAVNNWKGNQQNTKVSEIYCNGTCLVHGFC